MEHASHTRDIATTLRERVVPSNATRYGVVIGIEQYRDERLNLRCARADAEAMYRLMIDPECGMFTEEHVTLLLDDQATRENIRQTLAALPRSATADDTVWIYYAGHAGSEGQSTYWIPWDGDVDDLYMSGFPRREVLEIIEDIKAERLVLFLDCCHAAAMATKTHKTRDHLSPEEMLSVFDGTGRLTLAASDGGDKSVELPDKGHGAFSFYLVDGLRGAADTDSAGVVTLDALWSYLHDKVTKASQAVGNPQKPRKLGEHGHNVPLTVNPMVLARKRDIAAEIEKLAGIGSSKLSTEEAEYCLELLRNGPLTESERYLSSEFQSLIQGTVKLPTFKRLVKATMMEMGEAKGSSNDPPADLSDSRSAIVDSIESIIERDTLDRDAAMRRVDRWSAESRKHLAPLSEHAEFGAADNWGLFTIEITALVERRHRNTAAVEPYSEDYVVLPIEEFNRDVWDVELSAPPGFISTSAHWRSPSPERIGVCGSCGGRHQVECPKCAGTAEISCKKCSGTGMLGCKSCHMKGSKLCSRCSGVGKAEGDLLSCKQCRGAKRLPCTNCNGGSKVQCEHCNGSPISLCAKCGGKKTVECRTCGGAARYLAFPVIEREFVVEEICKYTCKRPEFIERVADYASGVSESLIFSKTSERRSAPTFSDSVPPLVAREVEHALEACFGTIDGSVVRNCVKIGYTHCVTCYLMHEGNPFEIHIIGPSRNVVSAGQVPKDQRYIDYRNYESQIRKIKATLESWDKVWKWCASLAPASLGLAVGAFLFSFCGIQAISETTFRVTGSVFAAIAVGLVGVLFGPLGRRRYELKDQLKNVEQLVFEISTDTKPD